MIISYERFTKMGARHGTQILAGNGDWLFVSELPTAKKVNRIDGFDVWEFDDYFPANQIREYHKSNKGHVTITIGVQLDSPRYYA